VLAEDATGLGAGISLLGASFLHPKSPFPATAVERKSAVEVVFRVLCCLVYSEAWPSPCEHEAFRRLFSTTHPASKLDDDSDRKSQRRNVMRFGGRQMRIEALPVKISLPSAPVGFVTVKDRTQTPLAERFIDCTREVANSDNGRPPTRRR
jgi:hypothetical protein